MTLEQFFEPYGKELHPHRDASFLVALQLAYERKVSNIVETGTTRRTTDHKGDGASTVIFADFCDNFLPDAQIYTCDINEDHINICKEETKKWNNIEYVVSDSIVFLERFSDKIDFLYLDSMDPASRRNKKAAMEHNFKELLACENKLHDDTIIFLDDTRVRDYKMLWSMKAEYTIPYLIGKGWEIVVENASQAVMVKKV